MSNKGWKDKFKEEFGIHFKGSSGELGFAIAFISKTREEAILAERKRIRKEVGNLHSSGAEHMAQTLPNVEVVQRKEVIQAININ